MTNLLRESSTSFLATVAVSAVALYLIKPTVMFTRDGLAKKFSLTKHSGQTYDDVTALPWWLAAILLGVISSNIHYVVTGE